jgi:hypothetical protein
MTELELPSKLERTGFLGFLCRDPDLADKSDLDEPSNLAAMSIDPELRILCKFGSVIERRLTVSWGRVTSEKNLKHFSKKYIYFRCWRLLVINHQLLSDGGWNF